MRSVAKGNYIKGKGGIKHALAHVRYLQMRGGDDRDHAVGRKRLFINSNREGISGSEVNERIKQLDESKVVIHRIVLSPGVEGVDMDAYTRAVMTELERSKGLDIEYYATEHKNTDHDHSHVVLLGRDQHGRQVTLNRRNYKTIREAGDRYLEKHHRYSRYLDKELDTIIRNAFKHDRGDKHFEWLLEDLKSNLTLEECDQRRRDLSPGFDKELAIAALPESERFVSNNVLYTKYSSLNDLIELDGKLTSGQVERLAKEQYQQMWSWIDRKKKFGEDYYEKTAEDDRIFRQLDEDMRRSFATDSSPRKSYRQYIVESKGRLLEFHEQYEINTQRSALQKEIELLNTSDGDNSARGEELQDQLDWLDAMLEERIESRKELPKMQRLTHNDRTAQSYLAKEKNPSFGEESDRSDSEEEASVWLFTDRVASKSDEKGQDESETGIEKLIFGDGPSINLSIYEKSQIERQIELWPEGAFDSGVSRNSIELDDHQTNFGPSQQEHQSLEELMQEHVHQTLHEQIQASFFESHIRADVAQNKEDKENEREDPGREHSR